MNGNKDEKIEDSTEQIPTDSPIVSTDTSDISSITKQATKEVIPEYPTFTKKVASVSPNSAKELKKELGISNNDLLVGLPADIASQFGFNHGDKIQIAKDGATIFLGNREIRLVTSTPKGPLTKFMLSKEIRDNTKLQDHRETGTGKPDTVPVTVVKIDGKEVLWIKTSEKNQPSLTI